MNGKPDTYAIFAAPKIPNLSAPSCLGGGEGGLMIRQLRWRKLRMEDMVVIVDIYIYDEVMSREKCRIIQINKSYKQRLLPTVALQD